jgi:NTP pyrophosphatase (non-canonical NTP hydrolase)
MKGERAIELIFAELRKAEEKYPGWPDDPVHAVAVLVEEAGEAMKEALDVYYKKKESRDLVKELAQTGAMAIRALIHLQEGGDDAAA